MEKYRHDDKDEDLPHYIDCNNDEILVCDYLLTEFCKSTCAYAKDVGGMGIGSMTISPRQSEKGIDDEVSD